MKQFLQCPNLDYIDLSAQIIYQTVFPNFTFEEIENKINIELNKK